MAREDGLVVESAGWDEASAKHRDSSKKAGAFAFAFDQSELEGLPATVQTCYRDETREGVNDEARVIKAVGGGTGLVLDRTPFYAESGGQVGDRGIVEGGSFRFRVDDAKKQGDVIVHLGTLESGSMDDVSGSVEVRVDVDRRRDVMRNHTATHLLHWALREVVGDHATQQGSLVAPDRLRFDVTHPRAITAEELVRIENLVNEKIRLNRPLVTTLENLDDARSRGVTALFGEKYDDDVRVVDIDGYSTELCGGTHCAATGDIGSFMILSEGAVQAGVRRIEALTGAGAVARLHDERRWMREAAAALKSKPEELGVRVEAMQAQIKELKRGGGRQAAADAGSTAKRLLEEATSVGEAKVIVAKVDVAAKDLAAVADVLRNGHGSVSGVLIAPGDGKVPLVAFASADLAGARVHAGQIAKTVAKILGGGGGGRPDFAQAGGRHPEKIGEALEGARVAILESLAS